MNYPAAELYLFIGFSLVFDILFDDGFIAILTNGVEIESARPEFTAPKQFFDLRVMFEYFLSSNVLIICTTLLGDITGTLWTRKCTWSLSVPISTKCISYCFPISIHMF
jgi:hypothetical protein